MKAICKKSFKFILPLVFVLFFSRSTLAQPYPFVLSPSGTTTNFMKFVPKQFTYNGTNYATGYLALTAYQNITTQAFSDPGIPVQKLQLQGGNILLCRTNPAPNTPDINPTSRNGAILFSDIVTTTGDFIHGKWGIEYDDQYSTGGLNIFKPKSTLTSARVNFNLFIRNDGNVGIGTATPNTKLYVAGEATISSLANIGGDNILSTDVTGKLQLLKINAINDNMGNCEAGYNIKMTDKFVSFDGTSAGIKLDINNDVYATGNIFVNGNVGVNGMIIGKPFVKNYFKLQLKGSDLPDAAYMELCDGHADDWRSFKFLVQGRTADYQYWVDNKLVFNFNGQIMTVGKSENPMNFRVNGKIDANEVQVSLDHWNDQVFNKEYKLLPISELESFIAVNKHLPEIPSEKEVLEKGVNLGDLNALSNEQLNVVVIFTFVSITSALCGLF